MHIDKSEYEDLLRLSDESKECLKIVGIYKIVEALDQISISLQKKQKELIK